VPTPGSRDRLGAKITMWSLTLVIASGGLWAALRGMPAVSARLGFPAWALAGASAGPDNTATAGSTNVVIFIIDTLRADRLNCYGYRRRITSPNIDALAEEGVLFERACAAAPWTLPSVASLLTSRFPCEHGVLSTRSRIAAGVPTLPRLLKQLGFTTIGLYANALVGPGLGFDGGYDFYRDSLTSAGRQVRVARQMHPGRPFFLYVHNIEPHNPEFFAPPHTPGFRDVSDAVRQQIAAHYRQYRNATWLDFNAGRTPGTTAVAAIQEQHVRGLVALMDDYNELYDACVRLADERVGSVIRALKERGEWDNTLFILLSDHGEEMHEHGGWSHDQSAYEELLRVPLVIRFPAARYGGRRVTDLVSLVDVMPTVLDALGRPELATEARGRSRMPLIRDAAARGDRSFYVPSMRHNVMSFYRQWKEQRGDVNVVVRRGTWKGIWNVELDTFELYDLDADAREQNDVASEHPDLAARMREYAAAWYEACADCAREQNLAEDAGELDEQTLRNLRTLGYIE
jgi:arylsulfatase A-like enzyme